MERVAGYKAEVIGLASPGTYIPSKKMMKNCNAVVIIRNDIKLTRFQVYTDH
jgi:hypothetical protein